ncbi:MAG TPA: aspartate carbamoyltransferase [Candidatus Saccharimonadales bacterium]|nr:aspartate carbamoyltransferase [Candidatus Saccharimonadales bacterium]
MPNPFFKQHFLSTDQLTKDTLPFLFHEIDTMKEIVIKEGKTNILEGRIIACVFFEPSTRTFASFTSAAQRLGAGIIPLHDMTNSSVIKGESLEDTIRSIGCSSDAIVLRHPEAYSVQNVAQYSYVPIINGGDGGHEHPTQSLLEAYTIHKHYPSLEGTTIGFVGDLKHSRTIRSLSKVLAEMEPKKFIWVSPDSLKMMPDVVDSIKKHNIEIIETDSMEKYIGEFDVMYTNRIQKERFDDPAEYEKIKDVFVTTPKLIAEAKSTMIILNPLPRVGEISPLVDTDPRALYIKEQMQNALYTRMALLKLILKD